MPDGSLATLPAAHGNTGGTGSSFSDAAQACGLTPRMLAVLASAVAAPGLSPTAAARRFNLPHCALSYATGRLRALGLIREEVNHTDRRRLHVFPTETGRELLHHIAAAHRPASTAADRVTGGAPCRMNHLEPGTGPPSLLPVGV